MDAHDGIPTALADKPGLLTVVRSAMHVVYNAWLKPEPRAQGRQV